MACSKMFCNFSRDEILRLTIPFIDTTQTHFVTFKGKFGLKIKEHMAILNKLSYNKQIRTSRYLNISIK